MKLNVAEILSTLSENSVTSERKDYFGKMLCQIFGSLHRKMDSIKCCITAQKLVKNVGICQEHGIEIQKCKVIFFGDLLLKRNYFIFNILTSGLIFR